MLEHEAFSFNLERRNLNQVYAANLEYTKEIAKINFLNNLIQIGQLKGKAFKAKTLSPRRLKGLGAFGISAYAYSNLTYLSFLFGHSIPLIAITACAVYGAKTFTHQPSISTIEFEKSG
jgi:hypothetical protein